MLLLGTLALAAYTPTVKLRNGVDMPLVACGSGGWKDSTAEEGVKVRAYPMCWSMLRVGCALYALFASTRPHFRVVFPTALFTMLAESSGLSPLRTVQIFHPQMGFQPRANALNP